MNLTLFDGFIAKPQPPYQKSSQTSKAAADSVRDSAPSQQDHVFACIRRAGKVGITRHEIAGELSIPLASVCARVNALDKKRLIRFAGFRLSPYGRLVEVLEATI